jgi:hypothetical protein
VARWILYLAPWLIWTAHFLGLYVVWSVEDLAGGSATAWRIAAAVFGAACAAGCVLCTVAIWRGRARSRQGEGGRLMSDLAGLGGVIAALAVLFQSLPAAFV